MKAEKPALEPKDIYGILPKSRADQYDMYEIIKRLVIIQNLMNIKGDYGKTLITAYARIDGWGWNCSEPTKIVKR